MIGHIGLIVYADAKSSPGIEVPGSLIVQVHQGANCWDDFVP